LLLFLFDLGLALLNLLWSKFSADLFNLFFLGQIQQVLFVLLKLIFLSIANSQVEVHLLGFRAAWIVDDLNIGSSASCDGGWKSCQENRDIGLQVIPHLVEVNAARFFCPDLQLQIQTKRLSNIDFLLLFSFSAFNSFGVLGLSNKSNVTETVNKSEWMDVKLNQR